MAEIAKLFASIGAETSAFEKALKGVDRDLNVAAKGFGQFQDVVTTGFKVMVGAATAAGAAFAAVVTGAVKTAASLEQQAANTAAVFGNMAPPIQEVKDLIRELGLDPDLVVSMDEAGAAVNMLAKNGIAWEDISAGIAKKTVLLANATGADFALAADAATDALALFNLNVDEMDRVLSSAVGMMVNSKFDMTDFAYILANLAPTASSLGISIEEMSGLVTATASSFKGGRTAATSWSLLLQNLTPQSEAASDAMKELGLITEEGANIFFDASGNLKDVQEVLAIIQRTFGGLTQEQQINYSRTIFGREAYDALVAILRLNNAELGAMIGKMGDMDAVMQGAETRTSTFAAAWDQLMDAFASVSAEIGDKFLPVAGLLVDWAKELVADHAPQVVEWFGQIADEIEDIVEWAREWITTGDQFNAKWDELSPKVQGVILAVQGFIDIVGHTLTAIGDFLGQWITWEDVWTAFALLLTGTVIVAVGNFIASISPLLLVIGSAITAVAALRTAWENDWGGIRTAFEPIVNFILAGFRSLSEAFWIVVADGKITSEEFSMLWDIASNYVSAAIKMLWDGIVDYVREKFPEWKATLGKWASAAWEWITETAIPFAVEKLKEWGSAIWGVVKSAFDSIVERVSSFIGTWNGYFLELTGGFVSLQDVILGLATVLTVQWVNAWVKHAIPVVAKFLATAAPFLGWVAAAVAAFAAMRLAWENDWLGIRTAFEPVIDIIERGFGLLFELFKEIIADGKITEEEWERLWDGIKIVFQRIGAAIWEAIKEVFGNIWDKLTEFGDKAWEEFAVRFPKTADALEQAFETAKTGVGKAMDYLQDRFGPLGQAIKDFGWESLEEIGKWATGQETEFEATSKIWETARDTFSTVMGDMKNVIVEFGNTAWEEFSVRFPKTADALEQAFESAKTGVDKALDFLDKRFADSEQAIKDFGTNSKAEIDAWAAGQQTTFETVEAVWGHARDTFSTVMGDMKNVIVEFGNTAWDEFSTRFPNTAAELERVAGLMRDKYNEIMGEINSGTKTTGQVLKDEFATNFPRTAQAFQTAAQNMGAAWEQLTVAIEQGVGRIQVAWNNLTGNSQQASGGLTKDWEMAQIRIDAIFGIMTTIVELFGTNILLSLTMVIQFLTGDWKGALDTAQQVFSGTFKAMGTIAKLGLELVLSYFGLTLEDVQRGVEKMREHGERFMQQFWEGVQRGWNQVKAMFESLWDLIPEPIRKVIPQVYNIGVDIVQGLWDGVRTKWDEFRAWWDPKWQNLVDDFKARFGIQSPSTVFREFGQNITDGLRLGIESGTGAAFGAMDTLSSGLTSRASSLQSTLSGTLAGIGSQIGQLANVQFPTPSTGTQSTTPNNTGSFLDNIAEQGFGSLADIANFAKQFGQDVASYAGSLAYDVAAEAGLVGSAYRGAVTTLTDDQQDTDESLINALWALIGALKQAPNDPRFQLNLIGDRTGNTYEDLSAAVAYLNALYGS